MLKDSNYKVRKRLTKLMEIPLDNNSADGFFVLIETDVFSVLMFVCY